MTKNHAWIFGRLIIVILTVLAFLWVTAWIFSISYPFWVAALLVWMFYPLVRFIRSKVHLPNGLAVLLVLLISLAVLIGAITGLVFLIIFGIRRISEFIPQWVQTTAAQIQDFFNESVFPIWQKLSGAMDLLTLEQQATLQDGIASLGTRLADTLTQIGHGLADGLTHLFIIIPTFFLAFLFIFIAFYFIGKDWENIFKKIYAFTPAPVMEKAQAFKNILRYRVFGFIRAQFIIMFIAFLIVFISLSIFRVDNADRVSFVFFLAFLFIFIAFYFIGKDWENIFKKIYAFTPAPVMEKAQAFKNILRYRVFGFIRAQFILMFIASLIVFIGLAILRVDHALTIAMIVGIAEILPYLGSGTILIPWFLYLFFTGDISMGIGLAIVYGVTVAVRQVLEPKILSSSMNLNALAVLISLFAGLKLFGVVGVFLGPLILVIFVIFIDIGVVRDLADFVKYGFKEDENIRNDGDKH